MNKKYLQAGAAFLCTFALAVGTPAAVFAGGDLNLFGSSGKEHDAIGSSQAPSGELIALDDQGISIAADNYALIEQDDGFVYVHTVENQNMPYVIIGYYEMSADGITDAFTRYMAGNYSDLEVVQDTTEETIGGSSFYKICYEYSVSGYTIEDTRLFTDIDGRAYMFGSKEVPGLNYLLEDGYLEQIAASAAPLDGTAYEKHVDSTQMAYPTPKEEVSGNGAAGSADSGSTAGSSTLSGPVETEPAETPAYTGNEVDASITFTESIASYEGTWVPFEDGFKLYLPSHWNWYQITEEQAAAGMLYLAGDPSGYTRAPYINVNYSESHGLDTLDELAADLEAAGFDIDGKIEVNGIPCVSYMNRAQDVSGLMFFHPYTTDYVFAVVAAEYSGNVDTQASILCSLSPNN